MRAPLARAAAGSGLQHHRTCHLDAPLLHCQIPALSEEGWARKTQMGTEEAPSPKPGWGEPTRELFHGAGCRAGAAALPLSLLCTRSRRRCHPRTEVTPSGFCCSPCVLHLHGAAMPVSERGRGGGARWRVNAASVTHLQLRAGKGKLPPGGFGICGKAPASSAPLSIRSFTPAAGTHLAHPAGTGAGTGVSAVCDPL